MLVFAVALPIGVHAKDLKPILRANQYVASKNDPFTTERRNSVDVSVFARKDGMTFQVGIAVLNQSDRPITVDQSRVFVLNANDRAHYR